MKKILILTPDGVGSTLLQRSLCVWGNLYDIFSNPHELTNGLVLKNNIIQKDWSIGYTQSLSEIIEILEQNQTNLIVRLAHYHILFRNDPAEEQAKFYRYLTDNFQIVSCHRQNILEYSMSWAIRDIKKTLNVYSFKEKFSVHPKDDSFNLSTKIIQSKLIDYTQYQLWIADNFPHSIKFYYESIADLDQFIALLLDRPSVEMLNAFNISMSQYCLASNTYNLKDFEKEKALNLVKLRAYINEIVKRKLMPNGLPLKMNSFNSKIKKTNNFIEVLETYNMWAKSNNQYQILNMLDINNLIEKDIFTDV
jgi:hypothetical protein